ncbi:hypothetical protein OAX78_01625 [Planctomycetota bacterium]|nr:hypothetical protein [Planctomycetota bacterium]
MKLKNLMLPALLAAAVFVPTTVFAQDDAASSLPTPPDGWWENVEPGQTATFAVSQMGQNFNMILTVASREEQLITFNMQMLMGDMEMGPPQTETLDASDQEQLNDLPEGSKVTEVGTETIEAGGQSWDCTIFEIETENQGMPMTMKMWHCPDLNPVFNRGCVKAEMNMEQGGMKMEINMELTEIGMTEVPQTDEAPTSRPASRPATGDGE